MARKKSEGRETLWRGIFDGLAFFERRLGGQLIGLRAARCGSRPQPIRGVSLLHE